MSKLKPIPKVEMENPDFEYKGKKTDLPNPAPQEKKYMGDDLNLFNNRESDIVDELNKHDDRLTNVENAEGDFATVAYVDKQDNKLNELILDQGSLITRNSDEIRAIEAYNLEQDSHIAQNTNDIRTVSEQVVTNQSNIADLKLKDTEQDNRLTDLENKPPIDLTPYELKTDHDKSISDLTTIIDTKADKTDIPDVSGFETTTKHDEDIATINKRIDDLPKANITDDLERYSLAQVDTFKDDNTAASTLNKLLGNTPNTLQKTGQDNVPHYISEVDISNWTTIFPNQNLIQVLQSLQQGYITNYSLQPAYSVDNGGTGNPELTITEFKTSDYDSTLDYWFEGYLEVDFDDVSIPTMQINLSEKLSGGNYVYKRSLGVTLPNGMLLESQIQVIFDDTGTTYKIDGIWHNSATGTIPIDFQNVDTLGHKWTKMTLTNARIYSVKRG